MNNDETSKGDKKTIDTNADLAYHLRATVSNVESTCTETGQLKREFKERRGFMIAVADAIGTGLIIGSKIS